jgi:thiamine pyrophosphokinase
VDKQTSIAVIFTGGYCDVSRLTEEDLRGDLYIAADAGRLTAEKCGIVPDVIAGDFDSSPVPADSAAEIIRVPAETDVTDTMLACDLAIARGANAIRILGGTGGRIDHELSNLFLLENLHLRGIHAVLCDGINRIRLIEKESLSLPRSDFRYFSLLALDDACVTLCGCKYPLTDAPLKRSLPYAVSNEITAEAAQITVNGGPVFLIESQ